MTDRMQIGSQVCVVGYGSTLEDAHEYKQHALMWECNQPPVMNIEQDLGGISATWNIHTRQIMAPQVTLIRRQSRCGLHH